MAKDDGGSVFTGSNHAACIPSEGCRIQPGLTLRDYFAAAALTGLANASMAHDLLHPEADMGTFDPESFAGDAYQIADAMLKAREGGR